MNEQVFLNIFFLSTQKPIVFLKFEQILLENRNYGDETIDIGLPLNATHYKKAIQLQWSYCNYRNWHTTTEIEP